MKIKLYLGFLLATLLFTSCDHDTYELVDVYTPEYLSLDIFRATSVEISTPKNIEKSGKIYVYKNYVFVNDFQKGIHIIENSNPENPVKIGFIKVLGNADIEVKNNYLYADSYMDLIVFDISSIENIKIEARLKNVFPRNFGLGYGYNENGIITGYKVTKEWRKTSDYDYYLTNDALNFNSEGGTGQGGSLARFKIVNDYLYAVDQSSINVFDISNLNTPQELEDVYVNFGIETIFNRGNTLFLGSTNGMYIYDISSPASPDYVSELQHVTSCDPVVVDGDYAYVTLRGGNNCGATESSLEIIDISDLKNPTLKERYLMDNPYGLGVKDDFLFICDGTSGLKVYNKNNIENLELLHTFKNINAFDVIPTANQLLMIGDSVLYQYTYSNNGIQLLSEFSLQ
ncbi:hypothetical protein [uncultured Polaribacter sp.]|uniref:LVIVD repeat-containing protein n=1 Tax=uncultured Polaribacter sp. TaxID=174711 RepID=UPI002614D3FB|nr:hypothetical protein [uncultured Polaribacter sp.]